jgi:hypothetical protein
MQQVLRLEEMVLQLEEVGRLCKESIKSAREKCNAGPIESAVGVSMMQRKTLIAATTAITGSRTRKGSKLVYLLSLQRSNWLRVKSWLRMGATLSFQPLPESDRRRPVHG